MDVIFNHEIHITVISEECKEKDLIRWRIVYNANDNPNLAEYFAEDIVNSIPVYCESEVLGAEYLIIKNVTLSVVSQMSDSDDALINTRLYGESVSQGLSKKARQEYMKKYVYGKIIFQIV